MIWESADVLKVPSGAVFPHADGKAIYVVADGKASLRPLRVGQSNGLATEILEGLEPGTPVAVYPGDKVRDGVLIESR